MKKEEKAKVGRPKLADNDLKMNSIVLCMMSLVVVLSLMIGAMFSLTSLGTKTLKGAASNTFTVKYNLNGLPVTALKDQSIEWGKDGGTALRNVSAPSNNYKFLGWIGQRNDGTVFGWKNKNGTGNAGWYSPSQIKKYSLYKNKAKVSKTPKKAGETVTMKAVWAYIDVEDIQKTSSSAKWNILGISDGKIVSYTLYKYDGSKWTHNPALTLTYPNFNNYSEKNLTKGTKYKSSVKFSYNAGEEVVLNKEFKTKNDDFYVKFDGMGATSGTMNTQNIEFGVSTALAKNTFKKTNATFKGWVAVRNKDAYVRACTTSGTCSDSKAKWIPQDKAVSLYIYKNRQKISKTVNGGETVTMVAQWNEKTSGKVNAAETDKKPSSSSLSLPSNLSLTNAEWKNSCMTRSNKSSCTSTVSEDYTCRWLNNSCQKNIPIKFAVKYNANGGTGTMETQKIEFGKSTALSSNKFSKSNATFKGWVAVRNKDGYVRGCTTSGTCSDSKAKWMAKSKIVSPYIYKDKQKISKTVNKGTTVTMVAQWEEIETSTKVNAAESDKKATTSSTKASINGQFKVEPDGMNCYRITAPEDAKYWRVHVYYKKASKKTFGINKISSLSKNHYDEKQTDKICFTKQKYDEETFRILLKVTTGANDKVLGKPKDWRPSGWKYNSTIGWAYKDYNVSW